MRIVSGIHKGRRIDPPAKLPVRPTTDMAKEGLFNILNNYYYFEELEVLDLFAGTGNMSYEFMSRGCKKVVAVELNRRCVDFIQQTSSKLKLEQLFIIRADVFRFLESGRARFDIIFADPPYDMDDISKIPELVFKKQLLKPDGCLILEHSKRDDFNEYPNFWQSRRYGNVNFSFFRR